MAKEILIKGAREHNLKNISLTLPRDKLIVITGLSGSGKSSLAFDTIYAEGQRRYLESLSAYARQFMEQMRKPDVDYIDGLSPSISIEQKNITRNPRSTVGTVTEIYDYLRLLYARVGTPHCHKCGKAIESQTVQQIVDQILSYPKGTKLAVLAPIARGKKGEYQKELLEMRRQGFGRARIDNKQVDLYSLYPPRLKKNIQHYISVYMDRLILKPGIESRLAEAIEMATGLADGLAELEIFGEDKIHFFSTRFACLDCGTSFTELEPRAFSFNSPHGACSACDGIGKVENFDPQLVVPDPKLSLLDGAVAPWHKKTKEWRQRLFQALVEKYGFSAETPFEDLSKETRKIILYGSEEETLPFRVKGQPKPIHQIYEGAIPILDRQWEEAEYEEDVWGLENYRNTRTCSKCHGARLKKEILSVYIGGKNIAELSNLNAEKFEMFLNSLSFSQQHSYVSEPILKEIGARLDFLKKVGLGYLALSRPANTLSGGEIQRIRLATQIGSNLVGVLYVLDEPSIGLHQRDNENLIETLGQLRNQGNSVIVVEHDEETIRRADYIVDLGPGAGTHGGDVIFAGPPDEIKKKKGSLTGEYLSKKRSIPVPEQRRKGKTDQVLSLTGAHEHNLKDIDVHIPVGTFVGVTGVSGSGKSSLIIDTLLPALESRLNKVTTGHTKCRSVKGLEHLDKVVHVNQSPIGRTPRSNPATYTGLFTHIRLLFSELPEAKMRGYKLSRFSFNVKGGRCEACNGDGTIKISMNFLPAVFVDCEVCQGRRYNRETLQIHYRGKSIADVLEMTIEEAYYFFERVPVLRTKLQTLQDVGLGYVHLGQSAVTLSGGEAQRIKLARELTKRATGRTLYILDEPTTGLHFDDVRKLMTILHALVEQGNTVIVIEHNMDVIKQADYLIDLGPEGGDEGGYVVFQGPTDDLIGCKESHTAPFLKKTLGR